MDGFIDTAKSSKENDEEQEIEMEPEFDQQLEEPFDDEHNEEHPADPPPSPPSSAEQVDFGSRFSVSTNKFIGTTGGRGTKRNRVAVFDNEISITSDALRENFNTGFDTTRPAEVSQNSADQNLTAELLKRQRELNIGEFGCSGEEAAFSRLIQEVFKIGEASVRAAKKPKRGGEFDDPIDDIELPRSQEDAALEDGDDLFHSRASSIARASDASSPAMEEARPAVTCIKPCDLHTFCTC